ncbi:MAG: toxic anion resistance protein [Oscillospiraceae bacterium]|nr:toxic anion resistance protein [Oscillospiraceae bacterium]
MADNELTLKSTDVLEIKSPEDLTLTKLSPKDQQTVREYAAKIDVRNAAEVLQFGAQAQQKLTVFADTALANVRNKDAGVVGQTLTELVGQLQGFAPDTKPRGGLAGIFHRATNQIQSLKARYEKVEISVGKVADTLEDHRLQMLRDIAMLDRLYDENVEYYKQLCFFIVAGRDKLDTLRAVDLPEARRKAQESGDPSEAQRANDLDNAIDRFEKKVYDLELTRQISIQMAPQIRLVQNNDALMAEKIHSTLVNTLPLWKSQMVLALGLENSRAALEAQRYVTDATNKMLRENAAALKQGTIETARESQRGVVDIETLVETNQALIDSLSEVANIQADGRAKRQAAEKQLVQLEDQLKQKLLQARDSAR